MCGYRLPSFWVAWWCVSVVVVVVFFALTVNLQLPSFSMAICQPFGGLFALLERSKASYGHHRPKARPLLQSRPLPPPWNLCVWCCWPHCVTWVKRLRKWDELVARNYKTLPCFQAFHWWLLFFRRCKMICIDTLACWEQHLGTFCHALMILCWCALLSSEMSINFIQLGVINWSYPPSQDASQQEEDYIHFLGFWNPFN